MRQRWCEEEEKAQSHSLAALSQTLSPRPLACSPAPFLELESVSVAKLEGATQHSTDVECEKHLYRPFFSWSAVL